jgi:cyclohexyl-isocyanide hydratase
MTTIGMVLFPQLTQLDLTGPFEVFCQMPDMRCTVCIISSRLDLARTRD